MGKHLLIALLALLSFTAKAIDPEQFQQLGVEQGLSQSDVMAIVQDNQGYMWFGTQNGLNRYDGYAIKQYRTNPFDSTTLSDDQIFSLHEDLRGNLWVGTLHGLNRYDKISSRFTRFSGKSNSPYFAVLSMQDAPQNGLWVGTNKGLWLFSAKNQLTLIKNSDSLAVLSLLTDSRKHQWIGTQKGLFLLNNSGGTSFLLQPFSPLLSHLFIYSMVEDDWGNIWLATNDGLFRLNSSTNEVTKIDEHHHLFEIGKVTKLLIDKEKRLWIGTANKGIIKLQLVSKDKFEFLENMEENLLAKNGLKSGDIQVLYQGKSINNDIIWIGTQTAGIHIYSITKNGFRNWEHILETAHSQSAKSVFAITTDKVNNLWVGTWQGLFQINRKTGAFFHIQSTPTNGLIDEKIQALLEDRTGNFWVGTTTELLRFDKQTKHFFKVKMPKKPKSEIIKLFEDSRGNVWVGADHFFGKINRERMQIDTLSLPATHGKIYPTAAIQEDKGGNLWLGTAFGLYKIDFQTNKISQFLSNPKDARSLISNQIYHIIRDKSDHLWLCSDHGFSRVTEENGQVKFQHFTTKNGLPNDFINGGVTDARGNIWLTTNRGISCFDPIKQTFKNYDSNDGLANNEFNMGAFHQTTDGQIYFGGLSVLVSFDPLKLTTNNHLAPIVVSSFQKFEQPINLDSLLVKKGEIELNYDENFFSFQLAYLDFTNPDKNKYAYQLVGFNKNWVFSDTRRYVSFTNIPTGNYVLKIKGSNADGLWNEAQILQIPIHIKPPFWLTWWFLLLTLSVIGLSIWQVYTYRVRLKIERALELEKVKFEENERVRKIAAKDLHDEFGNTITRISVLTEIIKNKISPNDVEVQGLLTKIYDNTHRMYQGTKDFIWSINPENDNFYEIAIRLKDFGDETFDKTGIQFQVQGINAQFEEAVLPMGASRHLVMMFKEAMSNTLKHAHATQTDLQFYYENKTIKVVWHDNGKGFDSTKIKVGNGLQNIRTRAKRIGGEALINTRLRGGTAVEFSQKIN